VLQYYFYRRTKSKNNSCRLGIQQHVMMPFFPANSFLDIVLRPSFVPLLQYIAAYCKYYSYSGSTGTWFLLLQRTVRQSTGLLASTRGSILINKKKSQHSLCFAVYLNVRDKQHQNLSTYSCPILHLESSNQIQLYTHKYLYNWKHFFFIII
jgi:hypothetical protein